MELGSYSLVIVRVDCYGHSYFTDDINYEWLNKVIIDDSLSSLNSALTYKEQEEAECNVNGHIIGAEFSSREWGFDSILPVSLPQKFKVSFVNKPQHRQYRLHCWGLNPRSRTSSALLLE
jgi:hypothetical protein